MNTSGAVGLPGRHGPARATGPGASRDVAQRQCSAGCQRRTNLHVLLGLQRSLGLITSDSREWSTRTPGYVWQTSMAHEACGQRRRHLTGQCHWWPLNRRWEGVSMWGSYQWRDQVRLRENLSEKNKTYNIKLLKKFSGQLDRAGLSQSKSVPILPVEGGDRTCGRAPFYCRG